MRLPAIVILTAVAATSSSCQTGRRAKPEPVLAAGPIESTLRGPQDPNLVLKMADVESIRATCDPAPPALLRVTVSGLLNDGATRIHAIQKQRLGSTVNITVVTARPRDAVATLALIPFERVVEVGLEGQPPGPLTVNVNGTTTTVMVP